VKRRPVPGSLASRPMMAMMAFGLNSHGLVLYSSPMANRWTKPERLTVALLALIAALTFFFPLLTVQVPIVGEQDVTGYDTASRIRQLTQEVRSASGQETAQGPQGGEDRKPSVRLPRLPRRGNSSAASAIPASIRFSWLIPVFVVSAFGCALLALLGSLVSLRVAKVASALGTMCGLLAILHLTVMNSDIHGLLEESVRRGAGHLKGSPLRGLAQTVESILLGGFSLKAGAGLYVLTVSLGLAALATHSRLLSRSQSTDRSGA
jgi:hypothetical protein